MAMYIISVTIFLTAFFLKLIRCLCLMKMSFLLIIYSLSQGMYIRLSIYTEKQDTCWHT